MVWVGGAAGASASAGAAEEDVDFDGLLAGYAAIARNGAQDAPAPEYSFAYRFRDKIAERGEYEERKRLEALEAKRAAAEERRLNEMRGRLSSLTDEELGELYSADYFTERLRALGYYKNEFSDSALNYRNAVIRLQADINMPIDAKLGAVSKKALLPDSPVIRRDEVSSPASGGYWITINKSKNILTVYKGAAVYKKYPVATGASMGLTPEGKFSFVTKSVNPAWGGGGYASPVAGGAPGNPLGKRWLGLSVGGGGSYGVHGNASAYSIGTYASHGCVRMINPDVEAMYEYIPTGTPVWIGTDSRLAEYGVRQYYTITPPAGADKPPPAPEPEPEPEPDPADSERAIPIEPDSAG